MKRKAPPHVCRSKTCPACAEARRRITAAVDAAKSAHTALARAAEALEGLEGCDLEMREAKRLDIRLRFLRDALGRRAQKPRLQFLAELLLRQAAAGGER